MDSVDWVGAGLLGKRGDELHVESNQRHRVVSREHVLDAQRDARYRRQRVVHGGRHLRRLLRLAGDQCERQGGRVRRCRRDVRPGREHVGVDEQHQLPKHRHRSVRRRDAEGGREYERGGQPEAAPDRRNELIRQFDDGLRRRRCDRGDGRRPHGDEHTLRLPVRPAGWRRLAAPDQRHTLGEKHQCPSVHGVGTRIGGRRRAQRGGHPRPLRHVHAERLHQWSF